MSKPSISQQGCSQADILSWKEPSLRSAQQTPKNVTTAHSRASKFVPSVATVQKKSAARGTTITKEPSVKSVPELPKIITPKSSCSSRPAPSTLQSESVASTLCVTQKTADMDSMVQSASHHLDSRNDRNSKHTSSTSQSLIAPLSPLVHDDLWHSITTEFPVLAEYLKETQLDQKLPEILSNIFKLKQLPFNPYAQLMYDVRPTMERYSNTYISMITIQ